MRSSASAFLISTPACAPRPTPTMIDIGVASPSAHGQAMISTLTAATSAKAKRGSGPNVAQAANASSATAMTAGTNQPATWSASRWIGARERCASATICTICAEHGVAADLVGAHDERAGLVERAADHLVAGLLGDRHRLAGHHRFVERRAAFDHLAVDRHLLAGPHAQPVADADRVERHLLVAAVGARCGARSSARDRAARGSRRRSLRARAVPAPGRAAPAR